MNLHAEIIGFIGAGLYLLSYLLLQSRRGFSDTVTYSAMNLIAASMVAYSLIFMWNSAAIVVQAMWIIISVFGILRCLKPASDKEICKVDLSHSPEINKAPLEAFDAEEALEEIKSNIDRLAFLIRGISRDEYIDSEKGSDKDLRSSSRSPNREEPTIKF